jgi:hypothetical protein
VSPHHGDTDSNPVSPTSISPNQRRFPEDLSELRAGYVQSRQTLGQTVGPCGLTTHWSTPMGPPAREIVCAATARGSACEDIPDVIDRPSAGAEPTARGFRHVAGTAVGEQGSAARIGCRSAWVLFAEWAAV